MTNLKQEVTREFMRIAQEHGGILRAGDIVDDAKDKKSPLHRFFDWDDKQAAGKWRLFEARRLIAVYGVTVIRTSQRPIQVRAFVSLRADRTMPGGGYRQTESILQDGDRYDILLAEAWDDLEQWRRKYEHLVELSPVLSAMEEVQRPSSSVAASA